MVRDFLFATAAAAAILAASAAHAASPQAYTIRFQAMVGAMPFHCGRTYAGLGRARASVTPEYLRFYISQVRLIDRAGHRVSLALNQDGTWQRRDVAFLSF